MIILNSLLQKNLISMLAAHIFEKFFFFYNIQGDNLCYSTQQAFLMSLALRM